jgi:hypothetical protein
MVLTFYFFKDNKIMQFIILFIINILFLVAFGGIITTSNLEIPLQAFALLALPIIWMYNGKKGYYSKHFQYFCYIFYPLHMFILFIISKLI